jgi:Large polyvalent protein associated domain 29
MTELSERDYVTCTDATRQTKAVLRKAFPGTKFTVSSRWSEIYVRWTDDGPTVEQVQKALLNADCAEAEKDWRGERRLCAPGDRKYWFDRFNAAERAGEQADRERRQQEYEAQRQREDAAVREASRAKREAMGGFLQSFQWPSELDPTQDQAVYEAFEALRQRAEVDVSISSETERQRRPSWAPALIIDGELLEACRELGYLSADDKPIVRLWAHFADPKKTGASLREQRCGTWPR